MNLLTLIPILEADLERITKSTKNNTNTVAYTGDDFTTTYTVDEDETELDNCRQICITHNTDGDIYIYINHTHRKTYKKLDLSDITTLTVS